jgi:glycerol kinase
LAQDLADMLNIDVERPAFIETTALGAAMLAGLGAGLFPNLEAATVMRGGVERFTPQLDAHHRAIRLQGWQQAMRRTLMAG